MADASVHSTAIVGAGARLAPGVTVGPFCILEGEIDLARGVTVGPHCHLIGSLTVGEGTTFGTGCVVGDRPQHVGYNGEPTRTVIGSFNTFREHCTVHRGMPAGPHTDGATVIADHNLFMVNSHVAHDCRVGNQCVFANGAVIGGHAIIGDRVLLSGNSAVHQNCRVGRLALIGGTSAVSQDLPPFWICQGGINMLHGVNVIGMRRAEVPREEITAVREAYKWLNRSGLTVPAAIDRMAETYPALPAIGELVAFLRAPTKRGICVGHQVTHDPTHDAT